VTDRRLGPPQLPRGRSDAALLHEHIEGDQEIEVDTAQIGGSLFPRAHSRARMTAKASGSWSEAKPSRLVATALGMKHALGRLSQRAAREGARAAKMACFHILILDI
jgi:hypothetical protein